MCLGNISGDFSWKNHEMLITWKKGLNRWVYNFSIDYRAFDTSNIIDIHTYWMKKHNIKYLGLLKKCLSNY